MKKKNSSNNLLKIIVPVICVFIAAVLIVVIAVNSKNKNKMADELTNGEKAEEAISDSAPMNEYENSESETENVYPENSEANTQIDLNNINVGETFTFGAYEQDNDTSNGKEDIEWLVLDKADGKALVISKYALDCQEYNTSNVSITWESCSLRTWMNGTFLTNVFSADEQAKIVTTTVSADKNPEYDTKPGNATNDKVFLLSITEAEKYFTTDEARRCAPTAYAKAQGAYTSDNKKTTDSAFACCWWLRSPGYYQTYAANVYYDGSVYYGGFYVNYDCVCVRPAIWINLES